MTQDQPNFCMAIDCLNAPDIGLDIQLQNGMVLTISVCRSCVSKFKGGNKN